MTITPFTADHYHELARWWVAHRWTPVPEQRLPRFAFLATTTTHHAYAGAYLDAQGTGVAMLEWIVTNPDNTPRQTLKALNTLLPFIRDTLVRDFDYDVILATCTHPALSRTLTRHQFQVTDRDAIHHVYAAALHHGLGDIHILAVASIASTVAATGVSVYSSQQQAKAEEAAANANARALEQDAKSREAEANEATYRAQRDARRKLAGMRATMADSGTQLNDGSNRDVLGAATNRLQTAVADQARSAQMDARALRHSAALSRWEGGQASAAAKTQAVGSVLSGFGKVAGDTYDYNRQGVF